MNQYTGKKVLVCSGHLRYFPCAIADGFSRNSCCCRLLEYRPDSILKLLRRSLIRKFHPWLHLRSVNRKIIAEVRKFKPDLVVIVNGDEIFRETVTEIASKTRIVHWAVDGVKNLKTDPCNLFDYNANYVFEPTDVSLLPRCKYVPLGAWEKIYFPPLQKGETNKLFDVSFVGSFTTERLLFFEEISKCIPQN
ncbi:MAG: hypothetical protein LUI04_02200, partial [Porphyromonadaceae bacterium]|nr:hypothetical protein [Porphyromonadaceae bacterium]